MAIADFGGTALGQPIEVLTFDHQNKPALGAQKLREWADTDGMTMLLGGSNTGVSLAMSAAAKEKKIPFIAIGAAGASLTGKDCTPYTIHYGYDTTALANGTAKTILEAGRQELVLPHRGLRVREATGGGGHRGRQGGRRKRGRRRSRAARDVGLLLLSPPGAGLGRAGARPRQRRRRHAKLAQGGVGIRPHQDDEARRAPGVPHRRSCGRSSRSRRGWC